MFIQNKLKLLPLLLLVTSFAQASGDRNESGPNRGKPPQEAFDACAGVSANVQCSITTPRGDQLSGMCLVPPQRDQLVCVPDNHRQGGDRQRHNEDQDA
jgi:hypothetical protein